VEIGKALSGMHNLEALVLPENSMTNAGLKSILDGIQKPDRLLELDVGANHLNDTGVEYLRDFLKKASNIQSLNLGLNQEFTPRAAAIVAESLQGKNDLKYFFMQGNQVNSTGGKLIAEALLDKSELRLLYIGGNKLNDDGAEAFIKVVEKLSKLQVLYIDGCGITTPTAIRLAHALKKSNKVMEAVNLSYNPISPAGMATIRDILDYLTEETLLMTEPDNLCTSICPSGALSNPEAQYAGTGMTCQEKEDEIFHNTTNLQCFSIFFDAIIQTDCCGYREKGCPLDCPEGEFACMYRIFEHFDVLVFD
jgi:Ran GTPase-activating protein (RanGAP) involved in mRNA processing and transport